MPQTDFLYGFGTVCAHVCFMNKREPRVFARLVIEHMFWSMFYGVAAIVYCIQRRFVYLRICKV